MKRHVVIIGAGVIGASIAYHLSQLGMRVTVLDADGPAAGASGASDSAVSIATKSPGELMELAIHSKAYYLELSMSQGPLHDAFHERSTFLVAENDIEINVLTTRAESLRQSGICVQELEGSTLRAKLPELRRDIPLVLEVLNEGHARGYQVVDRFFNAASAEIRRNTPVSGIAFEAGSNRCVGVYSNGNLIAADEVIVAAGIGSGQLLTEIDIRPQRGQLIITDKSDLVESFPGTLCFANYLVAKSNLPNTGRPQDKPAKGRSLVINPLGTGQFLIGSTRVDGGDPCYAEFDAAQHILSQAIQYVPRLTELDVIRVFTGIRAKTLDGFPIVGEMPGTPGLWAATGFDGDGICLAPIVGRELSKLMTGKGSLPEFDRLSPGRFASAQAVT
jgi:glycine/D-amino acid oxidase-like deaminating enzyme